MMSAARMRSWGVLVILTIAFFGLRVLSSESLVTGSTNADAPSSSSSASSTAVIPSAPTSTLDLVSGVRWPKHVSATAQIVRVIDGDTVEVAMDGEGDTVRVRLLGVNTPESVDPRRAVQCFGKEASSAAKQALQGKRVALLDDPQADDRDIYGRLLRTLVLENGVDVNATLVQQGFAHAYLSFPLSKVRKAQLRALERAAEAEQRGLWNPLTCSGDAYPNR